MMERWNDGTLECWAQSTFRLTASSHSGEKRSAKLPAPIYVLWNGMTEIPVFHLFHHSNIPRFFFLVTMARR